MDRQSFIEAVREAITGPTCTVRLGTATHWAWAASLADEFPSVVFKLDLAFAGDFVIDP